MLRALKATTVALATLGLFATTAHASLVIDLTTAGSSGSTSAAIGGTFIVQQIDPQSTGTGVIDPFLRIQQNGNESGFNTDLAVQFEAKAGIWTHALLLGDVPVVNVGGVDYFQFLLDINQTSPDALLSLNQIQIFLNSGDRNDYTGDSPQIGFTGATEVFRLNTFPNAAATEILLNYNLNPGSGAGDMFLYVQAAQFGTDLTKNLIFYSQFGAPPGSSSSNDGFEEWAVLDSSTCVDCEPLPEVPEPGSLLLLGSGLIGLSVAARRRRKA